MTANRAQMELFSPTPYRDGKPGWKGRATSQAAAEAIAGPAVPLRQQVLAELRRESGTPEEIALRLSKPLMNIRPRCSELAMLGLIADSGLTRTALGGRRAVVWQVTDRGRREDAPKGNLGRRGARSAEAAQ